MNGSRIRYLDYCRIAGIVFVVLLHSGIESIQNVAIFILPMFFALAGYVYDPEKRTRTEFVKERFRRLVKPFWQLNIMYSAVEFVRSTLLGYGTLKNILTFPIYMIYGSSILAPVTGLTEAVSSFAYPYPAAAGKCYIASPSANHLWFLPALFTGSIMFCLLEENVRKNILRKIVAVAVLLAIAAFESLSDLFKQLPWGIGTGAFGAACMLCGYWARYYRLAEKSKRFTVITAIAGLFLAVSAECLGSTGSALISSYYGPYGIWSICLTFAGGLGGAWTVMCLMRALDMLPWEFPKRMLSLAGNASMQIYEFHMLFLFVFGYIFLQICGEQPQLDEWLLGFIPAVDYATVFKITESLVIICLITWIVTRRRQRTKTQH